MGLRLRGYSFCRDNGGVDVDRLRRETRSEHEAVEALLPLMSPGLTRELYGHVLARMYRVLSGWESWASEHAPPRLASLIQERRRAPLLSADLTALGTPGAAGEESFSSAAWALRFPDAQLDPAAFEAAFLGAMYVLEGSTLGGQYIARHVEEALGFTPGVGDAYFRGYGEQTGSMWQAFKRLLAEIPEEHTDQVIAAAKGMFAHFGAALQGYTLDPVAELVLEPSGEAGLAQ